MTPPTIILDGRPVVGRCLSTPPKASGGEDALSPEAIIGKLRGANPAEVEKTLDYIIQNGACNPRFIQPLLDLLSSNDPKIFGKALSTLMLMKENGVRFTPTQEEAFTIRLSGAQIQFADGGLKITGKGLPLPNGAMLDEGTVCFKDGNWYIKNGDSAKINRILISAMKTDVNLVFNLDNRGLASPYVSVGIIIPNRPLVCYPGEHPKGLQSYNGVCDGKEILGFYRNVSDKYREECLPACSENEEQKPYYQKSEGCKQQIEECREKSGALPVIAGRVGALGNGPLVDIIPHLDSNGIDDFRSRESMLAAAKDPKLLAFIRQKGSINLLYPGSGSHMIPLEMVMTWTDLGVLNSAYLTYTEIDAKADGRIQAYLTQMFRQGLIQDFSVEIKGFRGGHEAIYSFSYKGKPIELHFVFNSGDELWARETDISSSDLVIFHDSVYNSPVDPKDHLADKYLEKLVGLSKKDGRTRFILTENQWEGQCVPGGPCTIGENQFKAHSFEGFYGCGSVATGYSTYEVKGETMFRRSPSDSDFMLKHHIHPEPNSYITGKAVLLIYQPN